MCRFLMAPSGKPHQVTLCPVVGPQWLEPDFMPGDWDVVVGGDELNEYFWRTIRLHVTRYARAIVSTKSAGKQFVGHTRESILDDIVDMIRRQSVSGGFVKLDKVTEQYYEVGDEEARKVVEYALQTLSKRRKPLQFPKKRKSSSMKARKELASKESQCNIAENKDLPYRFDPNKFGMRKSSRSSLLEDDCCSTEELDFFNVQRARIE